MLRGRRFSDLQMPFRLSRWMCLFPMDEGWEFSWRLCAISAPVPCLLMAYNLREASSKIALNFDSVAYVFRRALLTLMPTAQIYQAFSQRRRIRSCYQVVEQCERTLSSMSLCPEYRPGPLFAVFLCRAVFTLAHQLATIWLRLPQDSTEGPAWHADLHIVFCLLASQLLEVQLLTLLLVLRTLLRTLTGGVSLPPADRKRLESLAMSHHLLAGAADDLDNIYSVQILLSLSYVYMALVCFSLETIQGFLSLLKGEERWENVLRTSTWVLYCFSHFQFVAYNCVSLSKEVKKTNKSLYKVMLESHNKDVMRSGKLKLQLEMDRQVVLSASGMFPLDYTMVHSVAASSAVFLVIISQINH